MRSAAAAVLVVLLCAGCGSSGTSTGDGDAAHAKGVRFSQCMRKHGLPAFPDPDASGELTIDAVLNGSSLNPNGAAWKRAIAACRDLQPSGFTGHKRDSRQQAAALHFAQCIRENGVKDFPDPAAGQPLVDTNRIPSSGQPGGMAILNAAMRSCSAAAQAALAGR